MSSLKVNDRVMLQITGEVGHFEAKVVVAGAQPTFQILSSGLHYTQKITSGYSNVRLKTK